MADMLRVGIADYKVGKAPQQIISYGLGSCIGISLYDPQTKVGGLLHIMLPDSTQARAHENHASDVMRVGLRNAEAAKKALSKEGIRIIAEDTGGTYGRTVQIDLATGDYKVKTIDRGEKII